MRHGLPWWPTLTSTCKRPGLDFTMGISLDCPMQLHLSIDGLDSFRLSSGDWGGLWPLCTLILLFRIGLGSSQYLARQLAIHSGSPFADEKHQAMAQEADFLGLAHHSRYNCCQILGSSASPGQGTRPHL